MRKIKFRAWIKKEKKMVFSPEMGTEFDNRETPSFWFYLEDQQVEIDDVILMQFTDLTDRNGKEIYDGDIVNRNTGYPPRIVQWQPKRRMAGWFVVKPEDGTPYNPIDVLPLDVDGKEVEVIGNIWETPELLIK